MLVNLQSTDTSNQVHQVESVTYITTGLPILTLYFTL